MVDNIKKEMAYLEGQVQDLMLEVEVYNSRGEYLKSKENGILIAKHSKRLEQLRGHLKDVLSLYETISKLKEQNKLEKVVEYYERAI